MINIKELSFCHNLWFSNPNIFATQCRIPSNQIKYIYLSQAQKHRKYHILEHIYKLETLDISNYEFCYIKQYKFEISKFYDIGFQRYRGYKIRVCGKDSISLYIVQYKKYKMQICRPSCNLPKSFWFTLQFLNFDWGESLQNQYLLILMNFLILRICFQGFYWLHSSERR